MRKDKKARNEYAREYMKKKRQGLTSSEKGLTLATKPRIPYHIVEKLADKTWRERLMKMKVSFSESHHPDYASFIKFGDGTELSDVFDWLEVTG